MRALAPAAVLAALLAASPALAEDLGVRILTLKSPALGEERNVLVHLPPGYDESRRYPVLYFTDGPAHLPLLATTVRFLVANGRMPEVILVGLAQGDRARDLTPTRGKIVLADGRAQPLETSGGADKFLAFLADEVVPLVEKRYRTEPFRILAGHSLGGLFALHALQARPGLFQAIVAASPTLGWDGDLPVQRTRALLERTPELAGALFVAVGDEGREVATRFDALKAVLAGAKRLRWKAVHLEGEDHGTVVFDGFYEGLKYVFDGWTMPSGEADLGPKGGLRAVEDHYRALSQRLGYAVVPPEAMLELAGYQQLVERHPDEALRVLRRAVELYPGSAPAQRALGQGYEASGELDRAADAYRRAWEAARKGGVRNVAAYEASLTRVEAARQSGPAARRAMGRIGGADYDLDVRRCDKIVMEQMFEEGHQ